MIARNLMARIAVLALGISAFPAFAQVEQMQTVRSPNSAAQVTKQTPESSVTQTPPVADGTRIVSARSQRVIDRRDGKQEAEIDSLKAKLEHDGCFWSVVIKYEVEIEGFDTSEEFVLGFELLEDDRPVPGRDGQPIVFVEELVKPTKDKKGKREYERRFRIRVHKDWVKDDDDLELKASLVRVADGRIMDVADEDADQDKPGRGFGIGVGVGIGVFGVGIGISL